MLKLHFWQAGPTPQALLHDRSWDTGEAVYSSQQWHILLFWKAEGSGGSFAGWPCPGQTQVCLEIPAETESVFGTLWELSFYQEYIGEGKEYRTQEESLWWPRQQLSPSLSFFGPNRLLFLLICSTPSQFFLEAASLPLCLSMDGSSFLLITLCREIYTIFQVWLSELTMPSCPNFKSLSGKDWLNS